MRPCYSRESKSRVSRLPVIEPGSSAPSHSATRCAARIVCRGPYRSVNRRGSHRSQSLGFLRFRRYAALSGDGCDPGNRHRCHRSWPHWFRAPPHGRLVHRGPAPARAPRGAKFLRSSIGQPCRAHRNPRSPPLTSNPRRPTVHGIAGTPNVGWRARQPSGEPSAARGCVWLSPEGLRARLLARYEQVDAPPAADLFVRVIKRELVE